MNQMKRLKRIAIGGALTMMVACGGAETATQTATETEAEASASEDMATRAARLAQELMIIDTHIDVPYRLQKQSEDISVRTEGGDFDFPRAQAGGLNAPFMSIYVPADYQVTGGAKEFADELIDMVEKFATDWPDKFAIASQTSDLAGHKEAGLISLPLGIENGAPIEDDLANLQHFYDRGIRYITLTHGKNNQISDSSYELPDERKWNGLSPFGQEVVAEMNRLGIMIDVSHVSDAAFYQVMESTQVPVLATHSSCRHFTPDFERNMDDSMIKALAANGGVLQINFGSSFLTPEANVYSRDSWQAAREYAEANELDMESPEIQEEFHKNYRIENPYPYASIDDVVAHIDHVVKLVGIDHVGLGSDYDGVGDSLPTGLKDASTFPNLIQKLLEKGYSEEDIAKICGLNTLRVWRQAEEFAAAQAASAS